MLIVGSLSIIDLVYYILPYSIIHVKTPPRKHLQSSYDDSFSLYICVIVSVMAFNAEQNENSCERIE